jgi:hypothetical protein
VQSAARDRAHLYQQKQHRQVELMQGDVVAVRLLAMFLVVPTGHAA